MLGSDHAPFSETTPEDIDWAQQTIASRYSSPSAFHPSEHADQIAVLAARRAEAQAPMRAFLAGVPHPLDDRFEEMWDREGPGTGFSRVDAESNLAYIDSQRDLSEDERTESSRTLDAQEDFWREALRTHGRSLGVNQSIASLPAENASTPR